MIHSDECTVERELQRWNLVDLEGHIVLSIPFKAAANEAGAHVVLEQATKAYNIGHEDGRAAGRRELQRDIRDLLGAARD